jgi:hypothetical protein
VIDDPSTKVTIAVPSHLIGQWRAELSNKVQAIGSTQAGREPSGTTGGKHEAYLHLVHS